MNEYRDLKDLEIPEESDARENPTRANSVRALRRRTFAFILADAANDAPSYVENYVGGRGAE